MKTQAGQSKLERRQQVLQYLADWGWLSTLSTRKLQSELAKREKKRQRLLEAFPELEGPDPRILMRGLVDFTREGEWAEYDGLQSEIRAFKLELFHRNKLRSQKRAPVAEPTERESKIGFTSRTAGNINMFRKDCGWSLQELANQTGIDKKSIISHIRKGVKPTPRLLKEYAQAFSKGLNQPITPSKLEE